MQEEATSEASDAIDLACCEVTEPNDEGIVWIHDGEKAKATGPGFRPSIRVMLSGTYDEDYDASGVLTVKSRRWIASMEFMGQHLWDRQLGVLNRQPTWRMNYLGVGLAGDYGWLPVADIAGPTMSDTRPKPGWFQGFKTADYFAYGIRFNEGRDQFEFSGQLIGSDTFANNDTRQRVIGPQIAIGRVASKGRWRFDLSGTLMLGYGEAKSWYRGGFGTNITTGDLNDPAVARPLYSRYELRDDYFAQHAEVRFTTSYHYKRHWTIDAMVRGFVTSHWYNASEQINYTLPTFGLNRTDAEPLAGANLFLGVTYLR